MNRYEHRRGPDLPATGTALTQPPQPSYRFGGRTQDAPRVPVQPGPPIADYAHNALKPGTCHLCNHPILTGQRIARTAGSGTYAHVPCIARR